MQESRQMEQAYKQLLAAVQSHDRAATLRTVLHEHPELLSSTVEELIDESEALYSAAGEPGLRRVSSSLSADCCGAAGRLGSIVHLPSVRARAGGKGLPDYCSTCEAHHGIRFAA
jgi:hypothetical protein